MKTSSFKDIAIYQIKRYKNEIRELENNSDQLTLQNLHKIDQLHYLGIDALDEAAKRLKLSDQSCILDIGSGLGGPARYLTSTYRCQVAGIEIQKEMYDLAVKLTKSTGLSDRIEFIKGDITSFDFGKQKYDHFISILTILHIKDRSSLFSACKKILKPGGTFYIEDFFQKKPFTPQEIDSLKNIVSCPYLPDKQRYLNDLSDYFKEVVFEDVSDLWTPWVVERADNCEKDRERHIQVHGIEIFESMNLFYKTIAELFKTGNLSGVRITGRNR